MPKNKLKLSYSGKWCFSYFVVYCIYYFLTHLAQKQNIPLFSKTCFFFLHLSRVVEKWLTLWTEENKDKRLLFERSDSFVHFKTTDPHM